MISKLKNRLFKKLKLVTYADMSMSALDIAIDNAIGNGIDGDYLEFGVYKGESFVRAYYRFREREVPEQFAKRKFIALDSFEGLPDSKEQHKPVHFTKGAYSCDQESFGKTIEAQGVDLKQVTMIPGFYNQSLQAGNIKPFNVTKAAVVYIDVDLYSSAVDVFAYLTDIIETGSIIVLDDWFRHTGTPNDGIQKACAEWQEQNPHIELITLHQWRRIAFIVNKK